MGCGILAGYRQVPHHEIRPATTGVLRGMWWGDWVMWLWLGNAWANWQRLCGIQRGDFVGPLLPDEFHVQFPWELRTRLWLGARLKRATIWVLGDLVPDPFDEDGPHLDHMVAIDDGDESV